MQTWGIRRPTRRATCAEVECAAYVHGWVTTADESTDLGRAQAAWIRGACARRFTEQRTPVGLTAFTFPAEQTCFEAADHRVPLERPPLYVLRGGDWRGNPRRLPVRRYSSAESWVQDFGEHQQGLRDAQQRG
jgi:hypothetical protein